MCWIILEQDWILPPMFHSLWYRCTVYTITSPSPWCLFRPIIIYYNNCRKGIPFDEIFFSWKEIVMLLKTIIRSCKHEFFRVFQVFLQPLRLIIQICKDHIHFQTTNKYCNQINVIIFLSTNCHLLVTNVN